MQLPPIDTYYLIETTLDKSEKDPFDSESQRIKEAHDDLVQPSAYRYK